MADRIMMDEEPVGYMAQDEMIEVGAEPVASMAEEPVILMVSETEEPTL